MKTPDLPAKTLNTLQAVFARYPELTEVLLYGSRATGKSTRWCREVAGLRIHGTTRRKPLMVFQDEERHALVPWDDQAYEIADWRCAKVHQDHHIQCRQALY